MKYSNKFHLPETILRAAHVNNDKYNRGNVERSVTQLIQPPRIDMLRKAHFMEMEKDISEEWWALLGSAVHYILEMGAGPKDLVEERLFATVDGWSMSGMCDLQEYHKDGSVSLSDYKVTTAYALMMNDDGSKIEWEQQLNLLAYLLHLNRPERTIKGLAIVAIVRDWQRKQAAIDPMYPRAPVVPVKVKLWSLAKQESYVKERIRLHRESEMLHEIGAELPECSDHERWMRDSSWAVTKDGGSKASRVYATEREAASDLADRKPGYHIDFRPGKSVRCEGNYCGVAEWCNQWRRIREANGIETDEEQAA